MLMMIARMLMRIDTGTPQRTLVDSLPAIPVMVTVVAPALRPHNFLNQEMVERADGGRQF
jgi:hypothetical protein